MDTFDLPAFQPVDPAVDRSKRREEQDSQHPSVVKQSFEAMPWFNSPTSASSDALFSGFDEGSNNGRPAESDPFDHTLTIHGDGKQPASVQKQGHAYPQHEVQAHSDEYGHYNIHGNIDFNGVQQEPVGGIHQVHSVAHQNPEPNAQQQPMPGNGAYGVQAQPAPSAMGSARQAMHGVQHQPVTSIQNTNPPWEGGKDKWLEEEPEEVLRGPAHSPSYSSHSIADAIHKVERNLMGMARMSIDKSRSAATPVKSPASAGQSARSPSPQSKPKFCTRCGQENVPNANFCGYCGLQLMKSPIFSDISDIIGTDFNDKMSIADSSSRAHSGHDRSADKHSEDSAGSHQGTYLGIVGMGSLSDAGLHSPGSHSESHQQVPAYHQDGVGHSQCPFPGQTSHDDPHTDGRVEHVHQERRHAAFSFGFGGMIVCSFPIRHVRFAADGRNGAVERCYPGALSIRRIDAFHKAAVDPLRGPFTADTDSRQVVSALRSLPTANDDERVLCDLLADCAEGKRPKVPLASSTFPPVPPRTPSAAGQQQVLSLLCSGDIQAAFSEALAAGEFTLAFALAGHLGRDATTEAAGCFIRSGLAFGHPFKLVLSLLSNMVIELSEYSVADWKLLAGLSVALGKAGLLESLSDMLVSQGSHFAAACCIVLSRKPRMLPVPLLSEVYEYSLMVNGLDHAIPELLDAKLAKAEQDIDSGDYSSASALLSTVHAGGPRTQRRLDILRDRLEQSDLLDSVLPKEAERSSWPTFNLTKVIDRGLSTVIGEQHQQQQPKQRSAPLFTPTPPPAAGDSTDAFAAREVEQRSALAEHAGYQQNHHEQSALAHQQDVVLDHSAGASYDSQSMQGQSYNYYASNSDYSGYAYSGSMVIGSQSSHAQQPDTSSTSHDYYQYYGQSQWSSADTQSVQHQHDVHSRSPVQPRKSLDKSPDPQLFGYAAAQNGATHSPDHRPSASSPNQMALHGPGQAHQQSPAYASPQQQWNEYAPFMPASPPQVILQEQDDLGFGNQKASTEKPQSAPPVQIDPSGGKKPGVFSMIKSLLSGSPTDVNPPNVAGTPAKANLGEQSRFYYDPKLGRWVEEGSETTDSTPKVPAFPPRLNIDNASSAVDRAAGMKHMKKHFDPFGLSGPSSDSSNSMQPQAPPAASQQQPHGNPRHSYQPPPASPPSLF